MIALNTVVANEAHRIVGLLDHASRYCDELVVVVDEKSRDQTYDLAVAYGATVVVADHSPYCEVQRPLAAEHTESEWILVLDADEVLAPHAMTALPSIVNDPAFDAARFPRHNTVGDQVMANGLDPHLRLFRKGTVTYGLNPHSWIEPDDETRVFFPQSPGWIIHEKSEVEYDRDVVRTLKIRSLVRSGVIRKMGPDEMPGW